MMRKFETNVIVTYAALGGAIVMRGARRWLKRHWHLFGAFLLLVYFAYHGVHGDRGLLAWIDKSREVEATRVEQAALASEIADLEAKVTALQPNRADPDLLEEKLRELGYIRKGEVIIVPPRADAASASADTPVR